MARNHKFFFDADGTPRARGPSSEKTLMTFLEVDVQGSDHVCRDLMDDLTAIDDGSDDSREFIGNAHTVTMTKQGVVIALNADANDDEQAPGEAQTPAATAGDAHQIALKHFREILEDWEAFILDDQIDESLADEDYL